jgi:hypothetical protein
LDPVTNVNRAEPHRKRKTPLNSLQAGRTAGPEQRRGRYEFRDRNARKMDVKQKKRIR